MINSLTGRFLVLTIIFVMIAEIMIFLPSVGRFRYQYLLEKLVDAEIASLTAQVSEAQMLDPNVQEEILRTAGVLSVAVREDNFRELVLASPELVAIEETYDLRQNGAFALMRDAISCMFQSQERVVLIIGGASRMEEAPPQSTAPPTVLIEAAIYEPPLREALWEYGRNILLLSLLISVITAALLFVAARQFIVMPISRVVRSMIAFRDNPQDNDRIIVPHSGLRELRDAEDALQDMQKRVATSLKEQDRLAQLGGAVARVSHDLRNMLTTATLLADRMEMSEDPGVARTAPKLVASLNRGINLCERTLTFGKASEPPPQIARIDLGVLVRDVIEAEQLRENGGGWSISGEVPESMTIEADAEQLYRVITNLARNARQAIEASGRKGSVHIEATAQGDTAHIDVEDTGPGLPVKAREKLFKPFEGGTRRDGTGLGLAIAAELVKGHGGRLELKETGPEGTTFRISLPKGFPQTA